MSIIKTFSQNRAYSYLYTRMRCALTGFHNDMLKLFIEFLEFNFYQGKLRFELDIWKEKGCFFFRPKNILFRLIIKYKDEIIYDSKAMPFHAYALLVMQVEIMKAIYNGKFDLNK